ncbi:MAG TPA: hypothetical protein VF837_04725, partial [Patescibacteria group bacterium]
LLPSNSVLAPSKLVAKLVDHKSPLNRGLLFFSKPFIYEEKIAQSKIAWFPCILMENFAESQDRFGAGQTVSVFLKR